jgi:hypothetical protein
MSSMTRRQSQFLEEDSLLLERQRRKEHFKRVTIVFLPQILVLLLYLSYIFIGAACFQFLDESLAAEPFLDVALFSFTTIATIGYGTICPKTKSAKIFCVVYSLFGMPLCVAILANFSKYLSKAYWMACICVGKGSRIPHGEGSIPIKLILFLYFILFIFGSLLYPQNQKNPTFTLQNLYFSVISFSTVGFGDEAPKGPLSFTSFLSFFTYLMAGMVLSAILFGAFHRKLSKLNKIGKKVKKAQDVVVWFGDKPVKVSKLLQVVAKEFDAKPCEIHQLLHGLDALLEDAVAAHEAKSREDLNQNTSSSSPSCSSLNY